MRYALLLLPLLLLVGCQKTPSPSTSTGPAGASSPERLRAGATGSTTVTVTNTTSSPVTVNVAFSAASVVTPSQWSFCNVDAGLTCAFTLTASPGPGNSQSLPLAGQYLNATLAFNSTPSCNSTKAELNVNNPTWYDIVDVSLVDGYSNDIEINANGTLLGPPNPDGGNASVFGLFPYGCDICVARQSPPCGISPGGSGCKSGTQYNPTVPCQYQGPVMGGGSTITVSLMN